MAVIGRQQQWPKGNKIGQKEMVVEDMRRPEKKTDGDMMTSRAIWRWH